MTAQTRTIRYKNEKESSGLGSLVGLCIVGLLAVAIFVALFVFDQSKAQKFKWIELLTAGTATSFRLAEIPLGTEQDWWTKRFPTSEMTRYEDAGNVSRVAIEGGFLTSWFSTAEAGNPVYKLKFDRIFHGYSEEGIVDSIASELGPVNDAQCRKGKVTALQDCLYQWHPGEGIRIDLITKVRPMTNGQEQVSIQIIGTDTSRESKQRRRNEAPKVTPNTEAKAQEKKKPSMSEDAIDRIFLPFGMKR